MIRVQELSKSYGEVRAVEDVSFSIERGEVVGFLGPNGAGKSTTMKCLTGYLRPDGGRVEVGGLAVHPEELEAKRQVGYLPESTPLYGGMRVRAYLDFVGRLRRLDRSARRAAVARVAADCGLEGMLARRIRELSKGYRQRVGLAQALLADPEVLILDEPTSGLDPTEIQRIRELVRRLGQQKTILLSTHVLSEVQETCQRVLILARGRVVADGTPLDLAAAERVRVRLTLRGPAEAVERLAEVPGVAAVRATGVDAQGRRGFALDLDGDRHAVCERVAEMTLAAGWALSELHAELPGLEEVFLRRTEAV